MYKLAVDFNGGEAGDQVFLTSSEVYAYHYHLFPGNMSDMNMIAEYRDFDMLVKHGIIEKVEEPEWNDADMLQFSSYLLKQMEGVNKTKAEILNEFKILKGKQ